MSPVQTPFSAVAESFGDAFSEALNDSTQLARVSARLYQDSLAVLVEQQRLAGESAREWVSEITGAQSDLGREFARTYAPAARRGAAAAVESTEKLEGAATEAVRSTRPARTPSAPKPSPSRRPAEKRAAARSEPTLATAAPAWSSEGYDALSAAEVVEKLPGYSQRDLSAVDLYEQAHEARQTVLQRIESLRGVEPLTGYDELTVPEVDAKLTDGDVTLATAVRDYERQHKKREGVLSVARTLIQKG